MAYGVNIAVLFSAAIVLRQLVAAEVQSPAWVSVRLLSWLATVAASVGAVLMWLNLRSFTAVLAPETVTQMMTAAITITASAGVFLLIAVAHLGRRAGRGTALLLVVAMLLSVLAPLAARGRGAQPAVAARVATPGSGLQLGGTHL